MQLSAAFVPPAEVRTELERVVAGVPVAVAPPPPPTAARRGVLSRLTGRGPDQAAEQPADRTVMVRQLKPILADDIRMPIASFGNLTAADSRRLIGALREAALAWGAPRIRVYGATALEWPGDRSVWAKLDGDLDGLAAVARGVPLLASRLQLFVDRRRFRPLVEVGSITDDTTAEYLEDLVAALHAIDGEWWVQTTLSVQRPASGVSGSSTETVEELPLGTAG